MGALGATLLVGCSSGSPEKEKPREFSQVKVDEVRAAGDGMDVEFWVTDLSAAALGRALVGVESAELTDKAGAAWRGNGLRIYKTSAQAARELGASLPLQGQARRDSLPMLDRWMPLSTGRKWESGLEVWLDQQDWGSQGGSAAVAVSTGKLTLGPGSLRLLARSWLIAGATDPLLSMPGAEIPAAMVVELVAQHVDRSRSGPSDLITGPTLASPREEGQVFERLMIDLVCEPGQTIVIVPAHPREDWHAGTDGAGAVAGGTGAAGPSATPSSEPPVIDPVPEGTASAEQPGDSLPVGSAAPATPIGPAVPDLLTLGEAMLTDATVGRGASRRVIVVVTPRVPGKFEPLGAKREPRPVAPVR